MFRRPDAADAAPYYFTYIDQVPDGDVFDLLDVQGREALARLRGLPDDCGTLRYAPGKWCVADLVTHLSDAERLFGFRAFWFARGHQDPLPSFDQDLAVAEARADRRAWRDVVEECATVRASTLSLFRAMPPEMADRRGVASGYPVTVRGLVYIAYGHVAHHLRILDERYLASMA